MQLNHDKCLTEALGESRTLLVCRETDEEYELIVPHALLDDLQFVTCSKQQFKAKHGVVSLTRTKENDDWRRFDDFEVQTWPNQPPAWLLQVLNECVSFK